MIDADRIIVGNDNNLPFSSGRALGKSDDNELIAAQGHRPSSRRGASHDRAADLAAVFLRDREDRRAWRHVVLEVGPARRGLLERGAFLVARVLHAEEQRLPSGVNAGPQISAPAGLVKKARVTPRPSARSRPRHRGCR